MARSKYTLLLEDDDALVWDEYLVQLRRATGRRIGKAEMLRALVAIAATDDQVHQLLLDDLQSVRLPAAEVSDTA